MTSSSPPTLRVGIAGVGGGASQMVPAFQRHGSIKITAAADVDDDVLARFKRDLEGETYRSVEDMCKSPNVDLVYVATPNQFHTEHALTALDHHKHVHLEKPMTLNMEEAQTIVNTAERNGLQLTVNVKHRLRAAHPEDQGDRPRRRARQHAHDAQLVLQRLALPAPRRRGARPTPRRRRRLAPRAPTTSTSSAPPSAAACSAASAP